jgi:hypothetical protein
MYRILYIDKLYYHMKNLISKEEKDRIDSICEKYNIINYSINSDGSVDVDGNVNLYDEELDKFPLKFGKVSGRFSCTRNRLTKLEGAPHSVGGDFRCGQNNLTSLVGGPHTVVGDYHCHQNDLTSLMGGPNEVGGDFDASYNDLITTYSGDTDIEVVGYFVPGDTLPKSLLDNMGHIKLILKYQRHFFIWNDDLSLNVENFKDLISEIEEGLE